MSDPRAGREEVGSLPGRLELSGPAAEAVLDEVHALLERLWSTHRDVGEADRFRFETALIEIVGNVVEHAHGPQGTTPGVAILLGATDTELLASVSDNGGPVDVDLGGVAMPDADAESGRGLAIAAAVVDDLSYERGDDRNHWRVRCLRAAG